MAQVVAQAIAQAIAQGPAPPVPLVTSSASMQLALLHADTGPVSTRCRQKEHYKINRREHACMCFGLVQATLVSGGQGSHAKLLKHSV